MRAAHAQYQSVRMYGSGSDNTSYMFPIRNLKMRALSRLNLYLSHVLITLLLTNQVHVLAFRCRGGLDRRGRAGKEKKESVWGTKDAVVVSQKGHKATAHSTVLR